MTRLALTAAAATMATTAVVLAGLTVSSGPEGDVHAGIQAARNARYHHDAVWYTADASVTADPGDVVAAGGADADATRVTTVTLVEDHPEVTTRIVSSSANAEHAVVEAQQDPALLAVTVDSRVSLLDEVDPEGSVDPRRKDQWALTKLNAAAAWTVANGSGVSVAVIDTGINAEHPDLLGQVTPGVTFLSGTGVPSPGDGRTDKHGHGTHVSGIISAVKDNGLGITGLAPAARLVPVKVLGDDGSGWNSDVASGLIWAADNDVDVVNLSLGGPADPVLKTAVEYALSKGTSVVAAAGNSRARGNQPNYPAAYPGVIAVAATSYTDTTGDFSNTGSYLTVAAPGVNVLSTVAGGYASWSGTSMSAPYVAGVVALMQDRADRAALPGEIFNAVLSTATDLGAAGHDQEFGAGLVNPWAAVCAVTSCPGTPPPAPRETPAPPAPVTPPSIPVTGPPVEDSKPVAVLDVSRRVSYVTSGDLATVRATLTSSANGMGVALAPVVVTGTSGGRVVFERTYLTGTKGEVVAHMPVRKTTRIVLSHPGSHDLAPQKVRAGRFIAMPKVEVGYTNTEARVLVVPSIRQRVTVQKLDRNGTWANLARRKAARGGPTVLPTGSPGQWRVKVSGKAGYAKVLSMPWKIR